MPPAPAPPRAPREFDLVVYGANGFTGSLAAEYLARRYVAQNHQKHENHIRVALAGRDARKVTATRDAIASRLSLDATRMPVLEARDDASLDAMCARTACVLTFAGPYDDAPRDGARAGGLALARACATRGTDYLDITGEPRFVKRVIETCHETATRTGAAVVSCCGYDSIPWDVGCRAAADAVRANGGTCASGFGHAGKSRGGVSGGTIASAANAVGRPRAETRGMGDPLYLAKCAGGRLKDATRRWRSPQSGWRYDEDVRAWTMPSVMAGINAKVVGRSYALDPDKYGPNFEYDEADLCASKKNAVLGTVALGAFGAAFLSSPLRWLMRQTILPKQGQGPSEETRENGYSHVYVVVKGEPREEGGAVDAYCAEFEFKNADPGYKGTAALACEAALCLAIPSERARLPWVRNGGGGGVMTPSACMQDVLRERLEKSENFSLVVKKLEDTVFLI